MNLEKTDVKKREKSVIMADEEHPLVEEEDFDDEEIIAEDIKKDL